MRSEVSDSLEPDDDNIVKEESISQWKPEQTTLVFKSTTKQKTVGVRDLNILMNMAANKTKAPPVPKRAKARVNEGSHAAGYIFNESDADGKRIKRTVNSVPRQPKEQPARRSRFKTESNDDSAMIDSCEEDQVQNIDECDIDSNELSGTKVLHTEIIKDNEEEPKGFGLFMCTALKEKGSEL